SFALLGRTLGLFSWQAGMIFFFAFILDGDIIVNEFFRWCCKKKKTILSLDEYSYTHKFLGHLPLIVIPLTFIGGMLIEGILLGILLSTTLFFHLIHDTIDKNFDGVRWIYPFNSISYKIRWKKGRLLLEKKDATQLAQEAGIMAKNARKSKKILRDNLFLCL
ncbi:MAG: hypothetical protein PHG59_02565, partial [Patescibacteria group bacterium]|nr:hypothetical protein [Patescibacteria group bacterium]